MKKFIVAILAGMAMSALAIANDAPKADEHAADPAAAAEHTTVTKHEKKTEKKHKKGKKVEKHEEKHEATTEAH